MSNSDKPNPGCPQCSAEMQYHSTVNNSKMGKNGKYGKYKVIRYKCEFCDIIETKFGDGHMDEYNEHMAKKDVKLMFKQQKENNE